MEDIYVIYEKRLDKDPVFHGFDTSMQLAIELKGKILSVYSDKYLADAIKWVTEWESGLESVEVCNHTHYEYVTYDTPEGTVYYDEWRDVLNDKEYFSGPKAIEDYISRRSPKLKIARIRRHENVLSRT